MHSNVCSECLNFLLHLIVLPVSKYVYCLGNGNCYANVRIVISAWLNTYNTTYIYKSTHIQVYIHTRLLYTTIYIQGYYTYTTIYIQDYNIIKYQETIYRIFEEVVFEIW